MTAEAAAEVAADFCSAAVFSVFAVSSDSSEQQLPAARKILYLQGFRS